MKLYKINDLSISVVCPKIKKIKNVSLMKKTIVYLLPHFLLMNCLSWYIQGWDPCTTSAGQADKQGAGAVVLVV